MWDIDKYNEFHNCIEDLISKPTVRAMSEIPQHYKVNSLSHSIYVSYISFLLCRYFRLDYVAASRGALLHDLFLYNRHEVGCKKTRHLTSHPITAFENASRICDLTEKEKDIILKHMWPLTIKLPKYKESFLVSLADKFCAIVEMLSIHKIMKIDSKLEMSLRYD